MEVRIKKILLIKEILLGLALFNMLLFIAVPYLVIQFGLENIELPNLPGIRPIIDQRGHILRGSKLFARMQEYDQDGNFVKGWILNSGGVMYHYGIDNNDIIHVLIIGTNIYKTFDIDGNILSQKKIIDDTDIYNLGRRIISYHRKDVSMKEKIKQIRTPVYWYPFYIFPTTMIYALLYNLIELYIYIYKKKNKLILL